MNAYERLAFRLAARRFIQAVDDNIDGAQEDLSDSPSCNIPADIMGSYDEFKNLLARIDREDGVWA